MSKEIESLAREINQAWLGGDLDWLRRHFDPEIVMVAPGFGGRVIGAQACVQSFEDFLTNAEVSDFAESDVHADVRGDTAIATFRFRIAYRLNEKDYEDSGWDIWVFARQEAGWIAVWRAQVPIDAKA